MPDAHPAAQGLTPVRAALMATAMMTAGAVHAAPEVSITATYEARLLVKVADLRTDQVVGVDGYKLGARVATPGALGVLKPSTLLVQADGAMAGGAPAPRVFVQTETNGAKQKRRVTPYTCGGPADPLSGLLRAALQADSASPCIGTVPVYDGRQRYDLTLSPAGRGTAKYNLIQPLACRIGFHPVSGFGKGPPKSNPFLRGDPLASFAFEPRAHVWVMTQVAIPTALGNGNISLTSLHIDGVRPVFAKAAPAHQPAANRHAHR